MTITATVTPQKPWKVSRRQQLPSLGLLIGAAVVTYTIVAMTPMKGKLAYLLLFFILGTTFQLALSWFKRGRAAAADTVAAAVMMSGAFIVFLPVASLLTTTVTKGLKGFRPQIFTHTMAATSYSDPLTSGGLIHAII